jgi:hypothetical protein
MHVDEFKHHMQGCDGGICPKDASWAAKRYGKVRKKLRAANESKIFQPQHCIVGVGDGDFCKIDLVWC